MGADSVTYWCPVSHQVTERCKASLHLSELVSVGPGRLYGLGVGPGDPELLTLKALRLLRTAQVVAYPAPEQGDSFARSIVATWLEARQREIPIRIPMRPSSPPSTIYDAAAAALAAELDRGDDVALLCQGDPFFYGSCIELWSRLGSRYRVEIVPGVCSLVACAASAATPLVSKDETLTVIPATLEEAELTRRLVGADAAAIVKLGRHFRKVRRVLDALGLLGNAGYVERATLPNQRVAPLASVDAAGVPYFSMALIRRVPIGLSNGV
jgi:precorrin-2/cobalt-factor-2 C20-methyltransferase